MSQNIHLISFDLCPFVQRSVITLLEKGNTFDVTYIDLANPPEWFLKISPFGKVPVLKVGSQAIFESAVINEYLDETIEPHFMPQDPLTRALNRSWIEFGSVLLGYQYELSIAGDEDDFETSQAKIISAFKQLNNHLQNSPYFNGDMFSLVDAAYAPLFRRFQVLEKYLELDIYENKQKVCDWAKQLLARESIKASEHENFESKYISYCRNTSSFMNSLMTKK